MKHCPELKEYRDGTLAEQERTEFVAHLEHCAECTEALALLGAFKGEIASVESAGTAAPSPEQVDQLLRNAQKGSMASPLVWIAAAAVLLVLGGGVSLWLMNSSAAPEAPSYLLYRVAAENGVPKLIEPLEGDLLDVPSAEERLLKIDSHSLAFTSGTKARILSATRSNTAIALENGSVECKVTPQKDELHFSVETFIGGPGGEREKYLVTVVGTHFTVTNRSGDRLEVAVEEGVVQVDTPHEGTVRVVAGKQLVAVKGEKVQLGTMDVLDDGLPEETPDTPSTMDTDDSHVLSASEKEDRDRSRASSSRVSLGDLQQLVLDGRYQQAENQLSQMVRREPRNADAWFLLADCQKKQRRFQQASATYLRAASKLSGRYANTAVYRAGVLQQDHMQQYQAAIQTFERFIAQSPQTHHMQPNAKLRLARLLRKTGNKVRADALLEEIVAKHKASAAAQEAKRLLR